jgi:hypothetical protein
MSEFKWHMMAEEMPEKGKKDYIVMGLKGGLYLAPRFEGYGESGDDVWFRDTRGNLHYPDKVLAWAEVPKLEDTDAQESENAKLRELLRDDLRPKYDHTLRMTPVEWREYDDDILRRACELGIEVQR